MKKIIITFLVTIIVATNVIGRSSKENTGSLSGKHISILGDSISTYNSIGEC